MNQRRLTILVLCLCGFIALNLFILSMPIMRGGRQVPRTSEVKDAVDAARNIAENARRIYFEDMQAEPRDRTREEADPAAEGEGMRDSRVAAENGPRSPAAASTSQQLPHARDPGARTPDAASSVSKPDAAAREGKYAIVIPEPISFELVTASVLVNAASDYAGKRIRFRGHVAAVFISFEPIAQSGRGFFSEDRYLLLVLEHQDFPRVLIPRADALLMAKITQMNFGERVQVFGQVLIRQSTGGQDFFVIADDIVAD